MSYAYVQAKYYTHGGMVEPRAIVIHFAEGGGTVSWLTHPTTVVNGKVVPQDNSSHFIIEYSGAVVQMVKDADASHSLHVARPYGPPSAGDYGVYSLDAAKACLGAGIADPCAYIFAVEIEGYAATGPNAAQATSLGVLARDLRVRHPSIHGLLGHRDFQNYKACPGGKIPWTLLGGHGPFAKPPETATGADMALGWKITAFEGGIVTIKETGVSAIRLSDGALIAQNIGTSRPYAARIQLDVPYPGAPGGLARQDGFLIGERVCILLATNVTAIPNAAPVAQGADVKHTVTLQIDGVTSFTKAV